MNGMKFKTPHGTEYRYEPCDKVPDGLTWATPTAMQGQTVVLAFGDRGRAEPDMGAPYMSRHDRSVVGPVEYYRLVD